MRLNVKLKMYACLTKNLKFSVYCLIHTTQMYAQWQEKDVRYRMTHRDRKFHGYERFLSKSVSEPQKVFGFIVRMALT